MAGNPLSFVSGDVNAGASPGAPALPEDIELSDAPSRADVMSKFRAWFGAAQHVGLKEPASVVISSVDEEGAPNARILLCRGISEAGITFYTNLQSPGGRELHACPLAAATFHWMPLMRQVRMRGRIAPIDDAMADAYWEQRGRLSQLHAAISKQSEPLPSRSAFEAEVEALDRALDGAPVPRPSHWSGLTLCPTVVEFWTEGPDRFHYREQCVLADAEEHSWRRRWLAP